MRLKIRGYQKFPFLKNKNHINVFPNISQVQKYIHVIPWCYFFHALHRFIDLIFAYFPHSDASQNGRPGDPPAYNTFEWKHTGCNMQLKGSIHLHESEKIPLPRNVLALKAIVQDWSGSFVRRCSNLTRIQNTYKLV